MRKYIIRLDDASEYMDVDRWLAVARVLDKYDIKPIFGIIPDNKDPMMRGVYEFNDSFWDLAKQWVKQGWVPALHGYDHKYVTKEGGINPVNDFSEFAGLPFEEQRKKLKKGREILLGHGIYPEIFFAPGHTFDDNTIKALKKETDIKCISDTVATDMYKDDGIIYIPVIGGCIRNIPFRTVTYCYHPNTMTEADIRKMDRDLGKYLKHFSAFTVNYQARKRRIHDKLFSLVYFMYKRQKSCLILIPKFMRHD